MFASFVTFLLVGVQDGRTGPGIGHYLHAAGADGLAVTPTAGVTGTTVLLAAGQPVRPTARAWALNDQPVLTSRDTRRLWCAGFRRAALVLTTASSATPILSRPAGAMLCSSIGRSDADMMLADERARPPLLRQKQGVRSANYRNKAPTSRWMFCTTRTRTTGGPTVGAGG